MDRRLLMALPFIAASFFPIGANADCECRSNGQIFKQGQLACIRTNAGMKLARCDMSQNVSSWAIVRDDCPSTNNTPLPAPVTIVASDLSDGPPRPN